MNWLSRCINPVLDRFDLRVGRTSSIHKMLWKMGQLQEQVQDLQQELERRKQNGLSKAEMHTDSAMDRELFSLSRTRRRSDEPDEGLTSADPDRTCAETPDVKSF